jgi:hypothetical protein
MQLPIPATQYSKDLEVRRNRILTDTDRQNRKLGADVELNTDRLILHSPGGHRFQITVSDIGVLSAVQLS